MNSERLTLFDTPNIAVDLEYSKEFAIVHLRRFHCTKLSLRELKQMLTDLSKFLRLWYTDIWTGIPLGRTDLVRLAALLEFDHVGTVDNMLMYRKTIRRD